MGHLAQGLIHCVCALSQPYISAAKQVPYALTKPLRESTMSETKIRLTQYSHGAGCGCKIAPSVLETFLQTDFIAPDDPKLLVGNDTKDDAAVYDLGDGTGVISTTDFFMPIVDDAFEFGRVAATNAISDIYAMGGSL